jgi:hypothetical protein
MDDDYEPGTAGSDAEDDPRYADDADSELDPELATTEPADPAQLPPDEGDAGEAGDGGEPAERGGAPSVSGLDHDQRVRARDRSVQAAMLALHHAPQLHYTQGASRWEGIQERRSARLGQFPTHADCSSFATWCLWNGLALGFGVADVVNGANWSAGFTGTMLAHGKRVRRIAKVLRGDCVLYGNGPPGHHTALVVGVQDGRPMVVSHGSEAGPFFVAYDYRPDVMEIRRYI